jgi:hypothetical protein
MAVGRRQGDAQGHSLLVDDISEAGLAGRVAQGANDEALAEERMGWIGDFDLFRHWVLEAGIKRWLLSIASRTPS